MLTKKGMVILSLVGTMLIGKTVFADNTVTISEKTLLELEGTYSSDDAYFYAKIENTTDEVIVLDQGKLVAFNENDDILFTEDYISPGFSSITLKPGDYTYVDSWIWETALEDEDISDYKFSMKTKETGRQVEKVACEATFESGEDKYDNYIYVTFTNTTEEPRYNFYITVALHDKEGNLIYVATDNASNIALHPESTLTVRININSDLVEHYSMHDIEIDSVDAIVYYEVE